MTEIEVPWGPNGKDVYERTYSRVKDDGTHETWEETVVRVVDGNLGLVPAKHIRPGERKLLIEYMTKMRIIPAGRHLWLSGVPGKQFINNCYVAPWGEKASRHFGFVFDQLMQGGGVGANYTHANYNLHTAPELHLVCDEEHPDFEDVAPYLSTEYNPESVWAKAVEDSREGWIWALTKLVDKHQFSESPYKLVIDLSRIRRKGAKIKTFGGTSAGPGPLAQMLRKVDSILREVDGITARQAMEIDHAIAECVVSGNVRRSARMSILHWLHWEIEWFIKSKTDSGAFWSTNISVEIDGEFIDALHDPNSDLHDRAKQIYSLIISGMRANGEPGIWNSSLANEGEPNAVTATNPCGEICLPEGGVCCLGHVNLDAEMTPGQIRMAHDLMTRFLIRATFADIPDPQSRVVQDRDRRIGLGHFGLHGFLAKQRVQYSQSHESQLGYLLEDLYTYVEKTAQNYARELRIPVPVKLTTVAPTGTIAKLAGRSEGIHPIFAPYFIRRMRFSTVDPRQKEQVRGYVEQGYHVEDCIYSENTVVVSFPSKDPLVDELEALGIDPEILEASEDISLEDQLVVQELYQKHWADNAVSYTVNLSEADSEALSETLLDFLRSLKGTTVFPAKSRPQSPYERITKEQYEEMTRDVAGVTSDGVDEECATGACPIK